VLDGPSPKMAYDRGVLELMRTSREHELWKKNVARIVEHYAYLKGIDLRGYGSATFKKEAAERGAEPDECYLIGKRLAEYPEIVVEVVRTAPLLNKVDIYRSFGVAEVWVYRDGAFTIHVLDANGGRYERRTRSALLPELDFALVAKYVAREDTPQAVREFEGEVGKK
jgi:Uma2 family endonuclease